MEPTGIINVKPDPIPDDRVDDLAPSTATEADPILEDWESIVAGTGIRPSADLPASSSSTRGPS